MTKLDRQTVLDFIATHPSAGSKRDIARGLKVSGPDRQILRTILNELESDGTLERTGKRAWSKADTPPTNGIILFESIDEHGDLIGRAMGRDGPFGPPIIYAGLQGKRRGKEPGVGDRALARVRKAGEDYKAVVIKTLAKSDDQPMTGVYSESHRGGRVTSANRKDKRDFLISPEDKNGAKEGDLVLAEPKQGKEHGPKRGVVKRVLGRIDDPRAASLLSIAAFDIPTEFPEDVLKQAREATPSKAPREDLTQIPLITIDPHDARDHDDAVWAEELSDGWRVIVAIADVSAFVTDGSALDREAWKRGNSTYFPDRVVPMLPEELSADACSLREGENRACMAVELIFDKAGTKRSHRFIRGTMRSAAKLSYEEAQAAIDGNPNGKGAEMLEPVLKPLWGAYAALTAARERRGPLELDLPERKVIIGKDGRVEAIRIRERFDAHKLIEEMMIQANVAAAETLEKAKHPLLYRVHDQPTDAKIAALADFLKTMQIKWPLGERPQPSRFNKLLLDHAGTESSNMISEIVLRSQSQAVYAPDNLGHFGLNLKKYAHFTSPIRRYADLIVHRALISAMELGDDGLSDKAALQLEETATHLVTCERRSMAAERSATDRYLALFLADRVGAEFEGRITGVTRAGLFVRLDETGADGFLPISKLSDDYWVHEEAAQSLVARRSGKRFELGMRVRVELAEAAPLTGGILLKMLSAPKPGKAWKHGDKPTRSGSTSNSGKGRKKSKRTTPKHKRKAKARSDQRK